MYKISILYLQRGIVPSQEPFSHRIASVYRIQPKASIHIEFTRGMYQEDATSI